jgi:hypothetical protein
MKKKGETVSFLDFWSRKQTLIFLILI